MKRLIAILLVVATLMPLTMAFRECPDVCAGGDLISGTNGLPRDYPDKGRLYGEDNSNNTYIY